MPADPIFGGRPGRAPDPLPWWYRGGLIVLLAAVAAVAVTGTALAMLSSFNAPFLILTATPLAYGLIRAWRPVLARADNPRGVRPAVIAVAIVVGFVGLQMYEATEHVIVDRDPGVYLTTGMSISRTGSLLVDPQSSAFGSPPPAHVHFDSPGYYSGAPGGQLYPQFLHVLPVLIAVGHGLAGPAGAVKVPPLLEGIALLTIYAFATRFLRPTLALAVLVLAALNLTTIVFSRDAYTEPLTQLLLFGALWTLWPARKRLSPGLGTAAGFLFGVCVMTRIDAIVYLIPIVAWGFFELHRDWNARRWLGPAALAASIPCALAVIDGAYFARPYTTDLAGSLVPLVFALVLVCAFGWALVWRRWWFDGVSRAFQAHRSTIAVVTALAAVTIAAGLWLVRPLVTTARSSRNAAYAANLEVLQRAEHVTVDGARTYAENSVQWLSWYLSPTVMLLGIGAMGYLVWRVLRGERREFLPFLGLFVVVTTLYAWRPSIDPNQVWAMRRFFPVTIPGFLLLAAFGAELLAHWMNRLLFTDRDRARLTAILAICLAGPALIVPLRDLRPVVFQPELASLISNVDTVCAEIPSNALVYIPTPGLFADRMAPALRSMCGAHVAIGETTPADPATAQQLQSAAAGKQRPFFVVSDGPTPFGPGAAAPALRLVASAAYKRLALTVESVPDVFWDEHFDVWVARWP